MSRQSLNAFLFAMSRNRGSVTAAARSIVRERSARRMVDVGRRVDLSVARNVAAGASRTTRTG